MTAATTKTEAKAVDPKACRNEDLDGAFPCSEPATHKYTWPGQEQSQLCTEHLAKLCKSAEARLLSIEEIPGAAKVSAEPGAPPAPSFVPPTADDVVRDQARERQRAREGKAGST